MSTSTIAIHLSSPMAGSLTMPPLSSPAITLSTISSAATSADPILKNKLYFFFNYLNSRIIRSQLTFRTVPLDSLRAGNITYINSSGGNSILTPAQVKALDPAGIGESQTFLSAFNSRFPHSNATGGDGLNSGGFNFNAPDNDNQTNYVARVDYNINPNMKAFARFTISRENATQTLNEFPNDPPSAPFIDRTYAFVIGHNWVIGANKTNRAFVGETVEKFDYPLTYNPDGSTWLTFGDGTTSSLTSATFYLQPNSQSRRIPVPEAGDDFTWSKGNHTWQMGGTFKDILAKYNNVSDFNSVEEGMGGHVFSLCGPNPNDCGTGVPSLRPSDINTSANFGTTPYSTYDEAFAFMLGRIGNIMSDFELQRLRHRAPPAHWRPAHLSLLPNRALRSRHLGKCCPSLHSQLRLQLPDLLCTAI